MSPHTVRVASVLLVAVSSAACATQESWKVRTEVAGGKVVEIPVFPIGTEAPDWRSSKPTRADHPPSFRGMEGSPVLDESGVQVGYVAEARTGIERGLVRIAHLAPPPSLSPTATQYLADLTHSGPESTLSPGDSICLLTQWGDSTSIPMVGTVASVDGGLVRCIVPDNTFGARDRWPGPCLFALARAPVVGFARSNGEFEKVCAPGRRKPHHAW